jgi:hypothetical protein
LVLQAIQQLEAENRIMQSDGEVYLIDWSDYFEKLVKICENKTTKCMIQIDTQAQKQQRESSHVGSFVTWINL